MNEKNSPRVSFVVIFCLLLRKRRWSAVQNTSTSFPLIWNNLVNYSAQQLKLAGYHARSFNLFSETLLKRLVKNVFKSYETWKWNLVDRVKKLPNAKLIIKFASRSVAERIFRDLRSKICISSEEEISADRENERLGIYNYLYLTE